MISVFGLSLLTSVLTPTIGFLAPIVQDQRSAPAERVLPRIMRIDPAAKEWKTNATPPMQLARRADQSLNSAKRTSALWQSMLSLPEGTGRGSGVWAILTPATWKLETIDLSLGPKELTKRSYIANGKQWTFSKKGNWSKPLPLRQWQSQTKSLPLSSWTTQFPIALAESAGSRRPFLAQFISQATARGMKIRSQTRTVVVAGKQITSYRIVGSGGKVGPQLIEVVFESLKGMPVTIRTQSGSGKKQTNLLMTFRWQFDPTQGFNSKDFILPSNSSRPLIP